MEVMMKRLEEASMEGNVTTLLELIRKYPLILDRQILGCYNETPLHISSMLGHLDFTNEILSRKPQLAIEADSLTKSTPLHLAAAKGCVEMVKSLLKVNPDVCFAVDKNGMNPGHVSAMKGKIGVLKQLVKARPSCVKVLVEKGGEKESIFHLCVKNDQFEALEFLVKAIGRDDELVKSKDGDGNTILHLAVADKKIEMIKFIISNTNVDVNETNANGYTALDILAHSRRDMNDMLISESLLLVGAIRSNHLSSPSNRNVLSIRTRAYNKIRNNQEHLLPKEDWLEKKRSVLMLVASLIATMAFTAGVNPVGGVWQETALGSLKSKPHTAGFSIMAENYPRWFQRYQMLNTISFISALSIILLLISGLPINSKFFVWIFMVIMWTSITSLAMAYTLAINSLVPDSQDNTIYTITAIVVYAWLGLMGLLLLGHTIRLIVKILSKSRSVRRREPVTNPVTMTNDNNV